MSGRFRKGDSALYTVVVRYTVGRTGPQSGQGSYSVPCRTFGPNARSRRPGFRSGLSVGEPPAPPWSFDPADRYFVAKVRRGGAGRRRAFGPKSRSTTGVSARNPGRPPGFPPEIPVDDRDFPPRRRAMEAFRIPKVGAGKRATERSGTLTGDGKGSGAEPVMGGEDTAGCGGDSVMHGKCLAAARHPIWQGDERATERSGRADDSVGT